MTDIKQFWPPQVGDVWLAGLDQAYPAPPVCTQPGFLAGSQGVLLDEVTWKRRGPLRLTWRGGAAVTEAGETARLTADVVLFGGGGGLALHVLLIERGWDPFKGLLALPGGHVDAGEETEDAAHRELFEETGLRVGPLIQVGAFTHPGRDPRGRYVTVAFAGRMPHRIEPTAGDDAASARWVLVDDVLTGPGRLAFDHEVIIRAALNTGINGTAMNP